MNEKILYYMVGNAYEGCGHEHRSAAAAFKCRLLKRGGGEYRVVGITGSKNGRNTFVRVEAP